MRISKHQKSNFVKANLSSPTILLVLIYAIFLIVFFETTVRPYLEGRSQMRWGADTLAYMDLATNESDETSLVSFGLNAIGPVFISRILGHNLFAIAVLQYIMFLLVYYSTIINFQITKWKILFISMAVNPMLIASILTLNKEITGALVLILLISYQKFVGDRSKLVKATYLSVILYLSFYVRWQQTIVTLIFILLNHHCKTAYARYRSLVILVIAIALIYPFAPLLLDFGSTFDPVTENSKSNSGLILGLNNLQNNYLFFIAFLPKILINIGINPNFIRMIEAIVTNNFDNPDDVYVNYLLPIQDMMMVTTFLSLIIKKGFAIERDSIYLFSVYSIIYCLAPFIQSRYFFPAYILLQAELFSTNILIRNKAHKQEVLDN